MDAFNDPHAAVYTEKPKRRKKTVVVVSTLIALIAALAVAWVCLNPYDAQQSAIVNASSDIQQQIDESTEKSRLWISVASTVSVDAETMECSAVNGDTAISVLDNLEANHVDVTYTITLEDGTQVYQSDLIAPGSSIAKPVLTTELAPGSYNAVATAQGFDPETHQSIGGSVSAEIILSVE